MSISTAISPEEVDYLETHAALIRTMDEINHAFDMHDDAHLPELFLQGHRLAKTLVDFDGGL